MDAVAFAGGFAGVVLLGLGTGAVTGLAPGLHVNNVAALVIAGRTSLAASLAATLPALGGDEASLLLACFLLAVTSSHAVFDFVPSVFFGAPSEETALSILPGHRLLLDGEGVRAVGLAARGAVLGCALAALLLVPLRMLLGEPVGLAAAFRPWAPAFLAAILILLLASEARFGRHRLRRVARAAWVQILAGVLGLLVLRGPTPLDSGAVLFPLFSGLFGMPNLIVSLRNPPGTIPPQEMRPLPPLGRREMWHAVRGTVAGATVSWLPGLSGGAAATLAALLGRRKLTPSAFMVILGAVSTSTAVLSVAVLLMIGRARSGAAAAVEELLGGSAGWADPWGVPLVLTALVLAAVVAGALAAPGATWVARRLAPRWSRIDTRRLSLATLVGLAGLIALVTGVVGLGIAALAAVVGTLPVRAGVRRVHLMASLLVPVLVGYMSPGP